MVNEYQGVSRNDTVLLCTYCNEQVTASKLFQVKQHIETAKHEAAAKRKKQTLLTEFQQCNLQQQQPKINQFSLDLW